MGDALFFGVSINNDVSYNWNTAFMNEEFISYITFQSNYTGYEEEISDYAYYQMSKLVTATFPNCYKRVGSHAFENCPNLTVTQITSSLFSNIAHEIGENAFANCSNLQTFIVSTPRKIGKRAFYNCSKLAVIRFLSYMAGDPSSTYWMNDIDDEAFMNCTNSYLYTDTLCYVNRIGKRAFANHKYTYPSVGYSICHTVDDEAFLNASNIQRIGLNTYPARYGPPGIMCSLGSNVFNGCTSLNVIEIGFLSDIKSNSLGDLTSCLKSINIFIPSYCMYSDEYLTNIGSHTFENYSLLSEVYISAANSIGAYAFAGCTNLKYASAGFSICRYIGDYAFYNCTSISQIFINNYGYSWNLIERGVKLSFGGPNIFKGCTNLSYLNLYACDDIPSDFFVDNSALSTIGIGLIGDYNISCRLHPIIDNYSITIGDRAFMGCHNLSNINGGAPINVIGKSTFYGCSNLQYVNIGSLTCTKIDDFAFYGCSKLSSATFGTIYSVFYSITPSGSENPSELSWYEQYFGNFSLTTDTTVIGGKSYYSGDSGDISKYRVSYIGSHAFHGCLSLETLSIGYWNVSYIGDYAFYQCTRLNNANATAYPYVKYVGEYAFYECVNLQSITNIGTGNSDTTIGAYAFKSCTGLKGAIIGASKIGSHSFENCSQMSTIAGPPIIKYIDEYAFAGCLALTMFTMALSIEYIGANAFAGCTSLSQIIFTQFSSVPTLVSTDAFNGIHSEYKVIVPRSLYSNILADSVWGLISDHIISST